MYLSPLPDLTIGLAYYALPIAMAIMAWENKSIWARRVLLLFAGFILSCGSAHLIDAWYVFHGECSAGSTPKTIVNCSTAILSVLTACTVIPMLPTYIMALRAPFNLEQIRKMLDRLDK